MPVAAIPWFTILTRAPAVVAAANALLEGSRKLRAAPKAASDLDALRQRVSDLEHHQQANAELSKQLAEHASAITAAAKATAAKARQAFVLAMVGVVIAVAALLLVWLR